jgi:4-methyl-5(b-hydroxyethyl)-thiazole monophosphate biosynthesis
MTELVVVPLAEGFEETEAVAIVDVLRRAELPVVTVSLDGREVTGSHGIAVAADLAWDGLDPEAATAVVLPGGMPGTTHLAEDERVLALVRRLAQGGRLVAAVCAAPLVLEAAGVLAPGTPYTSHPGVRARLAGLGAASEDRVVVSGRVITSQGPGTALEFALAVVEALAGRERADALAAAMLVPRGA